MSEKQMELDERERWEVGAIDGPMRHTWPAQIIGVFTDGTRFVLATFNGNFESIANAAAARAVVCRNALAGIEDPVAFVKAARRVAEWSNPPAKENDMPGLRLAVADLAAALETP